MRKIRVLHVISGDLWAGAEAQALTLMAGLHRNPEVELTAAVFNEGRLVRELAGHGIEVHLLDEEKLNSWRLLWRVRQIVAAEKPDIIHTHRYKENIIGALAARLSGRGCLVKTVHGLDEVFEGVKKFKIGLYSRLDRAVSKPSFEKVICVSEDIRHRLARVYRDEVLVTIHNSVEIDAISADTPPVEVRRSLQIPAGMPVIGTAGRLVPIKGIDYLLKATGLMRRQGTDLRVLIVGEGPQRESLEALSASLGLDKSVIFTGQRRDVFDVIGAMDLFVLPSLSEGIPMVILESMALGVPIVATRVGGIPEILEDPVTARLVPAQNETALSDACRYLLDNRAEATAMAARAGASVRENFSSEVMSRKVCDLYRSLPA